MKVVKVIDITQRLSTGKSIRDFALRVDKIVKTCADKVICLDFTGVTLGDITVDDTFRKMLLDKKYKRLTFKFYNNEQVTTMCKMLLKLQGLDEGRIENVVPESSMSYQTADEVYVATEKSKRMSRKLLKYTKVDDELKEITVYYNRAPDGTGLLHDINTKDAVIAIRDTVLYKLEETGYKSAIIDFGTMQLFTNRSDVVAAALCTLFNSVESKHYNLEFKIAYESDRRMLEMMHEIPQMSKCSDEILEKIDANITIGTVGLLSEYVQSEAQQDKFGHYGKGKVSTRQPAIYKGRNGQKLRFRVYDVHTFIRRLDWVLRKEEKKGLGVKTLLDNKPYELKYKDIEIDLSHIGICKFCDGAQYYFSLAIQNKEDEFLETHYVTEDGEYASIKLMLPQYIQLVLSENQEDFDAEMLYLCLVESEKSLKEKNIQIQDISNINFNFM